MPFAPKFALLGISLLALSACSEPELILPGEREAVLPKLTSVQIDDAARDEGAKLGNVIINQNFGHPGFTAGHSGGHLSFEWPLEASWSASIEGVADDTVELAQPIILNNLVYAIGADGYLHAFDSADGQPRWSRIIEVLSDEPWAGVVGGLAGDDNHLLAHAGSYDLVSLSPETGDLIWSVTHDERLKGGPTLLSDEAVMVTDINSHVYVYDLKTGTPFWERSGQSSNTVVFGAPAPAFAGSEVVIAGSAGEVSVYDAATGDLFWADSLASFNPRTPLQELGDVRAHPIHDGKLIFVVSQSGRMVAYQASTGIDIWEQALTSIEMPWVAGDTIYVVTIDGRLYALRRNDGKARWSVELPGALPENMIASETVPRYTAPIVLSNNVFVIGRSGTGYVFDAQTGSAVSEFSIDGSVTTAPISAQNMMVILNNQGKLSVYR